MSQGSTGPDEERQFQHSAKQAVMQALVDLGMPPEPPAAQPSSVPRRSADALGAGPAPPRKMVLIDKGDGVLEWRDPETEGAWGTPRRGTGDLPMGQTPLIEISNEILGPNEIVAKLTEWDGRLTPNQGLRRWAKDTKAFEPISTVPQTIDPNGKPGGILLFIHGTFSNSEAIFGQLDGIERDAEFFKWAYRKYEHILAFDHPTLSVSPVINGLDLARLFADVKGPVDVICHSRGGLVARWWLEAFAGASAGPRRVVFVASPLGGTSLASPPKLRDALTLFTTVGGHLKSMSAATSVFLPFTTVAVALLQVFQVVTGTLARTPMADLFFSAVPGLGGMSRVGNSSELDRLQGGSLRLPQYFAVRSDFRMASAGWRFWRIFENPELRAAQWGANQVFDQANDLVVDNRSTIELFKGKGLHPDRCLTFDQNGEVFHTNYFTMRKVTDAFIKFLA
jgi:hypothetical protein